MIILRGGRGLHTESRIHPEAWHQLRPQWAADRACGHPRLRNIEGAKRCRDFIGVDMVTQ